jgi:ribosome-binding factor A
MPDRTGTAGAPSQRQLRVAEEIRHALAGVFARGEMRDPVLEPLHLTATEVRASPDLKHMTVFVAALGRPVTGEVLKALQRVQPWLRGQVARAVRLRTSPELHFQPDTALDYAMEIDRVMKRPEVSRDLGPREAEDEP